MNNRIHEVLLNLGYSPTISGNFFRVKALYRSGNSANSVSINRDTGYFIDFVSGDKGSWKDFLFLALEGNKESVKKYSEGEYEVAVVPKVDLRLMQIKKYDESLLNKLIPYYDFYTNRGISKETLKTFKMGLATNAKLKNRLVFPIRDAAGSIIGFAGRLIQEGSDLPKWLIVGRKDHFTFPLHLPEVRQSIIEKREVILVESIGDILALYDAGIMNAICIFGKSISKEILKQLIGLNVKTIKIGLNNDEESRKNWGQEGAAEIKKKAQSFFDDVRIIVPPNGKNDFGDCSKDQIRGFFNV